MDERRIEKIESSAQTMRQDTDVQVKKDDAPLFSVAILHYKQPEYWKEAVLSVLEQDYPAIQLIFSDDGTPEFDGKSVESFILEHRSSNLVDWQVDTSVQNRGTAANCDAAVAKSSGEYILLLDGDDALADSTVLTRFAERFCQLPEEANAVSANCLICDDKLENGIPYYSDEKIRKLNEWTAEEQYKNIYLWFFPVPSATVFRRRIFALCGGFQAPYVRLSQDGYYYPHILRMGQKFYVADFVACKHRKGGICSPLEKTPLVSVNNVLKEFVRIAEMEFFPYAARFSSEEMDTLCQRYYENLINYRSKTHDLVYGISEPAYSILKDWAKRHGIPWYFPKSKLHFVPDYEIWKVDQNMKGIQPTRLEECCGCTACSTACPQGAIAMKEDKQGFFYPSVNASLCVECGLCQRVCPQTNGQLDPKESLQYLAMKHTNEQLRLTSRSGGIFAAVAQRVLKEGGTVYGAAFDQELRVCHIRITQPEKLSRLQGSKYVQSDMKDCMRLAGQDLRDGRTVLFSGTPCQIEGLLRWIRAASIPSEGLLTMDVVCHGAPSPLVYERYLDEQEQRIGGSITAFDFRDKEKGWRDHCESMSALIDGAEKKEFSKAYSDMFYQHNMVRPSCYVCPFACRERSSDVTIADYWGVEKYAVEMDDDRGVSLVMPHTVSGLKMIESVQQDFIVKPVTWEQCRQSALEKPTGKGADYEAFWNDMETAGIGEVLKKSQETKKNAELQMLRRMEEERQKKLRDAWSKQPPVRSVGILTFHRAHNYGAMLQAWALRTYLKNKGYKAEIINYRCESIDHSYMPLPYQIVPNYEQFKTPDQPSRGIKMYLQVWKGIVPVLRLWRKRRKRFLRFYRQMGVRGRTLNEKDLGCLHYDAVICGSDQIWVMQDAAYYGAFPGDMRRIAYAPSFGNRPFPPDFHPTVYKWLHQLDRISVREESMIPYLEEAFGISPLAAVLDPTLLLTAEDYQPLLLPRTKLGNKPYVFCYCVLEDDAMVDLARKIACKNGWELIVLRTWLRPDQKDQIQEVTAGPREFVTYIHDAEFVISNSFHGAVFSILFKKLFYSVYKQGTNNRIQDLLDSLDLKQCHIEDQLPDVEPKIDWEKVFALLDRKRNVSFQFLEDSLL